MSSSSSSPALSSPPPEQLHYFHCESCDTILAACVPRTSLGKILTLRCGNCSNLIIVDTHGATNRLHLPLLHLPRPSHLLPPPPHSSHVEEEEEEDTNKK